MMKVIFWVRVNWKETSKKSNKLWKKNSINFDITAYSSSGKKSLKK